MKRNNEIRTAMLYAGVRQKELACELGMLPNNLSRKLASRLTQEEKQKYLEIIKKLKVKRGVKKEE
ncbi:MAG: hypothetical protein IJX99_01360 [Clostridia bacterium]|nr:hypothetical protein [Clostridia bacterium]